MTTIPEEHLVPLDERDAHSLNDQCPCVPFLYARVHQSEVLATEVRHNSFDALPVDEKALEKAQGLE